MCVCLCAYVWCPVTVLPRGWTSKLSNQALLKLHSPQACLYFLPPLPKLFPPFGLPKPPFAGRLVEGQESANQGRPGSPAFSSPGRLWDKEKGWCAVKYPACAIRVLKEDSLCCINNKLIWKLFQHIRTGGAAQCTSNIKQQRDIEWQVYKSDFCLPLTPALLTLPEETRQA